MSRSCDHVRFGIRLPALQGPTVTDWEATAPFAMVAEFARTAESCGFDFVSTADHIAIPDSDLAWLGPRWADPFVTLSGIAALTTTIELLTAVAVIPYRHPLALAKTATSLDWVSGGRLILGASPGYLEPEFAALGIPFAERGRITDENLRALLDALSGTAVFPAGAGQQFSIAPRAVHRDRPPIWIGGSSWASIRRAVRFGDGWVPNHLDPPSLGALLDRARDLEGFETKADRFRVATSLNPMGERAEHGKRAAVPGTLGELSADRILDEVDAWERVGVTDVRIHLFTHSAGEFVDALHWLSEHVLSAAG
jgi:probable F420-dependent oxidoreductase